MKTNSLLTKILFYALISAPYAVTAQPGAVHFVADFSTRNNQPGHYYKMVSWDDTPYREFTYWKENATGGVAEFMNWRVIFPAGYDPSGSVKYPMIVMLHGAGESGRIWTNNFEYHPGDPEYDNNSLNIKWGGKEHMEAVNRPLSHPQAFPGIVIFPQVATNGAWATGWENGVLDANNRMAVAIIEYMISSHNVNQYKIAVHGLSNGAKGSWDIAAKRPDLFAAYLPMSGVGSDVNAMTDILVPTPLWLFQGGLDTNPTPGASNTWTSALQSKGGSPKYTLYPGLGHGTWNTAYDEPEFFSWILAQDKRNIHVVGGSTVLCPGGTIKLGISSGFLAYQWNKDGSDIPGATTQYYIANAAGQYKVRFQRRIDGAWDESLITTITNMSAADAPTLTATGSLVLPIQISGSVDNVINLVAPSGFSQYKWLKNGVQTSTSASNIKFIANAAGTNAALAGSYTVQVLMPSGCYSPSSNEILITYTNPQPTTPAFNILARTPQSPTQVQVTWQDVAGETGYEVWRYRKQDYAAGPPATGYPLQKYKMIAALPSNAISYIDNTLRPGASYIYRIRAVMTTGAVLSNQPNPTYVITPNDVTPPTIPSDLINASLTPTEVALTWNASTDNDLVYEYEVYNDQTKIATVRGDTLDADRTDASPAPATTYVVTGLTPNTVYTFKVRANDYKGNHSDYATLTVGTLPVPNNGLRYKYYEFEGTLASLSAFDFNQTPTTEGVVDNFLISVRLRNDRFVFSFDGYIQIVNPGTYRFYTNSDEGSRLNIDGNLVVNNDGLHGTATVSGTYTFPSSGKYPIQVTYFEQMAGQVLNVRYNFGTTNNYGSAASIPNDKLFQTGDGSGGAMMMAKSGEPSEPGVVAYPMPFASTVNLKFKEKKGAQKVVLFDPMGLPIITRMVNSDDENVSIDFSEIPDGPYYMKVGSASIRVIKRQ